MYQPFRLAFQFFNFFVFRTPFRHLKFRFMVIWVSIILSIFLLGCIHEERPRSVSKTRTSSWKAKKGCFFAIFQVQTCARVLLTSHCRCQYLPNLPIKEIETKFYCEKKFQLSASSSKRWKSFSNSWLADKHNFSRCRELSGQKLSIQLQFFSNTLRVVSEFRSTHIFNIGIITTLGTDAGFREKRLELWEFSLPKAQKPSSWKSNILRAKLPAKNLTVFLS